MWEKNEEVEEGEEVKEWRRSSAGAGMKARAGVVSMRWAMTVVAGCLAGAFWCGVAAQEFGSLYQVAPEDLAAHQVGTRKAIRKVAEGRRESFRSVTLQMVVNEEGNVVSATAVAGPKENYEEAIAEARTWKYIPFEKGGVATRATFEDYVRILPLERMPTKHRDFPQISGNGAGVVMTLWRSCCYGDCPLYSVEIHADGSVIYNGEPGVVVHGAHRDHLSGEQLEELIETFRRADYFSLEDHYSFSVTDNATYRTEFRVDQLEKSVSDHVGAENGMPQAVTDVEDASDRIADTKKWIRGTVETVPALKRERFDFRSAEAGEILAQASAAGSTVVVRALLAEGVGVGGESEEGQPALVAAARKGDRTSVQMLIKAGAGNNSAEIKTQALGAAASTGDLELVKELIAYGGKPGEIHDDEGLHTVLMDAASAGVPAVVQAILAERPDANARDDKGRPAVWYALETRGELDDQRNADRREVVRLLAKAGADLNGQNEKGDTALHKVWDQECAEALIQEGADVNARNNDGETALMPSYSLAVMKLLVTAGADVKAKDKKGMTALDHVMDREKDGEGENYLRGLIAEK